jgi:hypothetical protein
MPLEYENRMGHVYYVHEGKTRTGKPRYYVSRNLEGNPIESVPDGYEIHELPERAQVVLRKVAHSAIKPFERDQVEQGLRRYGGLNHFIVAGEEHSLARPRESEPRAILSLSPGGSNHLHGLGAHSPCRQPGDR